MRIKIKKEMKVMVDIEIISLGIIILNESVISLWYNL